MLGASLDLAETHCTVVPTWQATKLAAWGYDKPSAGFAFSTSLEADKATSDTRFDFIYTAVSIQSGLNITFPRALMISPSASSGSCQACATLVEGYDTTKQGFDRYYFARGGKLDLIRVDSDPTHGSMHVAGTALHFVEWDQARDKAVEDGRCIDVGAFDFEATYNNASSDGGSD